MMTYIPPARPDDALNLSVDQLALRLLARFDRVTGGLHHRQSFLAGARQAYDANGFHNNCEVLRALGEAFDWLRLHGLLAQDPEQSTGFCYITRRGRAVLRATDGLALVRAEERLDVDLHPRIARKVRAQFLLGEYELAAFAALREVEIRVRELAGASNADLGVKLMRQAFSSRGPLADSTLEGGESEALAALFAGAIGVFKNPSSHRQVEYADPSVASEVVPLGDLLLRLLDSTAARIMQQSAEAGDSGSAALSQS